MEEEASISGGTCDSAIGRFDCIGITRIVKSLRYFVIIAADVRSILIWGLGFLIVWGSPRTLDYFLGLLHSLLLLSRFFLPRGLLNRISIVSSRRLRFSVWIEISIRLVSFICNTRISRRWIERGWPVAKGKASLSLCLSLRLSGIGCRFDFFFLRISCDLLALITLIHHALFLLLLLNIHLFPLLSQVFILFFSCLHLSFTRTHLSSLSILSSLRFEVFIIDDKVIWLRTVAP